MHSRVLEEKAAHKGTESVFKNAMVSGPGGLGVRLWGWE